VEAFCSKAFGGLTEQLTKSCTPEERKADAFHDALGFAKVPLEECRHLVLSVAAGRATFDNAAATACLATAHGSKPVDGTWGDLAVPDLDESAACDAVVIGKQDDGQPCLSTLDCKEPLTCIGATESSRKAEGTCKPAPTTEGAACDGHLLRVMDFKHRKRCGEGLFCEPADDVCRRVVPTGGACKHPLECVRPDACRAGKCAASAPGAIGEVCTDDTDDCKHGLFCQKTAGAERGVCADRKAAGATCGHDAECRGECKKDPGREDGKCASRCGSG
jgi:hypothetical protein